jgi:hypothetical protein
MFDPETMPPSVSLTQHSQLEEALQAVPSPTSKIGCMDYCSLCWLCYKARSIDQERRRYMRDITLVATQWAESIIEGTVRKYDIYTLSENDGQLACCCIVYLKQFQINCAVGKIAPPLPEIMS